MIQLPRNKAEILLNATVFLGIILLAVGITLIFYNAHIAPDSINSFGYGGIVCCLFALVSTRFAFALISALEKAK